MRTRKKALTRTQKVLVEKDSLRKKIDAICEEVEKLKEQLKEVVEQNEGFPTFNEPEGDTPLIQEPDKQ